MWRPRILVLALAALVAVGAGSAIVLHTETHVTTSLRRTSSLRPAVAGGSTLIYLRGTHLVSRSLGRRAEHVIADLHTGEAAASPDSRWIAYVTSHAGSAASGDGDFANLPELHVLNIASKDDLDLGPGFGPRWNADSTQLAFELPAPTRTCESESCSGGVRIMVATLGHPPRSVTGFAPLHLLTWAGRRVLVSDDRHLDRTSSLSVAGAATIQMPIPPGAIWDGTPDGSSLITVGQGVVSFTQLAGGRLTSTARRWRISGLTLGDGAVSPASTSVAAVLTHGGRSSRLASITLEGKAAFVPGSAGAMGNVVWNPSGTAFAYVGIDERHPSRLQAMMCHVAGDAGPACRQWFSWVQGISLLALSSS